MKIKREFSRYKFGLSYKHPEDFYLTRWQSSTKVDVGYLIYRLLYFLLFTTTYYIFARIIKTNFFKLVYMYFTHWAFVVNWLYALVSLVVVTNAYLQQQEVFGVEAVDVVTLNKIFMLLSNASPCVAFCVSIAYWTFVKVSTEVMYGSMFFHTWNSVLALMDFCIISVPYNLVHVYFPFILGVLYTLFTVVFALCDGKDFMGRDVIYKQVDWVNRPLQTTACTIAAYVLMVLVGFSLFLVFRLKTWVCKSWYRCNEEFYGRACSDDE